MTATTTTPMFVGGLGGPHDRLAAAALVARGYGALPLATLDDDALERGRAALPRGQCAPALYTTGALLRSAAEARVGQSMAFVSLGSCGPCRFSMFAPAWKRAVKHAGFGALEVVTLPQHGEAPASGALQSHTSAVLETLAVADAFDVTYRRLMPRVADPGALEALFAAAIDRVAGRIEAGEAPVDALARERHWHRGAALAPVRALGRVTLLGDPWSLHAHGSGQLHLPERFARVGVEVDAAPAALWVAYLLWQARQADWRTGAPAAPDAIEHALALETRLRESLASAAKAAGIGEVDLPSVDELADLASPHLSPSLRGGYGHLELGLAARAVRDRRCHAVVSVKSFGCIPSGGVADAIVPAVLGDSVPFLALDVAGHGDAVQESRLMMRAAEAIERAETELADACGRVGVELGRAPAFARPALMGQHEAVPRAYACTLACDVLMAGDP